MVFEVDPSLPNPDDLRIPSILAAAREEYARSQTGPLTALSTSFSYVPAAKLMPPEALSTFTSSLPKSTTAFSPENNPMADRTALFHRRFTSQSSSHSLGHVEYIFNLGNWGVGFRPNPSKKLHQNR
ncbi:hypothetical protein N0V88_006376 [Collariella sp. IMI 366227]|nr:hypothetical protein N0V88_006376 [Collariella sp. IMI 366227]